MTVYARSDVMGVAPSRDGHGGCGRVHSRPVEHGAPVKLWALECPQCETFLRTDDQWSPTISGIPETPDEKAEREDRELRGQQETTAATADAIQKLGVAVPQLAEQTGMSQQVMVAMLTALTERGVLNTPVPTVACAQGHQMPATAKFCGECGSPTADAPAAPVHVITSVEARPEPEDAPDFEALSIRELQEYARKHNIKTTVAKAKQIELIRAAQG